MTLGVLATAVSLLSAELQAEDAYFKRALHPPMYAKVSLERLTHGRYCRVDTFEEKTCGFETKEYCKLTVNELRYPNSTCDEE